MNLTDEEIRIKVAEAMEWTPTPEGRWTKDQAGLAPPYFDTCQLPNYPADLNACAEFEKTLTDEERIAYVLYLNASHETADIFYPDPTERKWQRKVASEAFCLVTTTSRQRCLAYLKTKGLIP